jgi:hypothetical protein
MGLVAWFKLTRKADFGSSLSSNEKQMSKNRGTGWRDCPSNGGAQEGKKGIQFYTVFFTPVSCFIPDLGSFPCQQN